jgi:hypothetical protein
MSAKVCFRCDWSGATTEDACPRCGATLHAAGRSSLPSNADDGSGPREATEERSWRNVVATFVVVALASAAIVVVQRHTPAPAGSPPVRSALGYLAYAAPGQEDEIRLWIWNLSASTVTPGPIAPAMPTELHFSYGVNTGWLALTTPTPSGGGAEASVFSNLAPTDQADEIGKGRLVAWLADGAYVSVVDVTALGGCRHHVRVSTWFVASGVHEQPLNRTICGEPTTAGRDLTLPYLTIERGGRSSVFQVNKGRLSSVLRGYRALSVSLNGDLLVQGPRSGDPLALYYPSPLRTAPTPIGRPGALLIPERVLGWDADANHAYVLGTIGGVRGVYRVTVGPRARPRSPALVFPTDATDVSASPTAMGDLYVAADGSVSLIQGGEVRPLPNPEGAPPPTGPLLWISTLPYSPAVAG